MDNKGRNEGLRETNYFMNILENIQIIPYGEVPATAISGKKVVQHFTLENFKRIIDNLNIERQNGPDIVLDLDHSSETTSDTSAAGWLSNFRICETRGLIADIELTPIGEDAVFNKIYKYLSPAVVVDAEGNPYKLTSVALTNRPRIKHIERIWNSISNAFSNIKNNIKSIFNSEESEVDVNAIKDKLDKNVLLEGQLFMDSDNEQLERKEDIIEEREEQIESESGCENSCESTSEDSSEQLDEKSDNVNSAAESSEVVEDKTLRDKILEFLSTFLTSKEEVEKLATFTDDEIISLLQSTFDEKDVEKDDEKAEVQEETDDVKEEVKEEVIEETLNSESPSEAVVEEQVINQDEASTPELEQITKLQEEYSLLNSPNARAEFLLKHRGQLYNHIVK